MIVIVDYGMGNLGSIKNMLKKVDVPAAISSNLQEIADAEKIILPGIGSFDNGMQRLGELGMIPVLNQKVLIEKIPALGICLGMQLMTRASEEGELLGLGWIEADTVRFNFGPNGHGLKIPHMGWNQVQIAKESALLTNMDEEPRFYFVHSYHPVCQRPGDVLLRTVYGYEFASGFQHGNIAGVQFHPEKSHRFGMRLLENFAKEF
jgi:imidazole glycerol-phosphate synthase subunit HisH